VARALLKVDSEEFPMKLSLLFACGVVLVTGCSGGSGSTTVDAGGDALADGAAASDGGDAGSVENDATSDAPSTADAARDASQACNALGNAAPPVTIQQVASAPPAPAGGTVADGTYFMTDVSIYTGSNGPSGPSGTAQTTIQVSGSTIQVVSSGQPMTRTVMLATSGSTFTSTDTCPDATVTHGSYSATATTFLIFLDGVTDDAGARTVVETFTKQ
jgi:hypothetical protein